MVNFIVNRECVILLLYGLYFEITFLTALALRFIKATVSLRTFFSPTVIKYAVMLPTPSRVLFVYHYTSGFCAAS